MSLPVGQIDRLTAKGIERGLRWEFMPWEIIAAGRHQGLLARIAADPNPFPRFRLFRGLT